MKKAGLLMCLALMSTSALSNSAVVLDSSSIEVSAMNFRLDTDTFGKKVDGSGVKLKYELERRKEVGYKLSYQNFSYHKEGINIDAEQGKVALSYTYPIVFSDMEFKIKPSLGVFYSKVDPLTEKSVFTSFQVGGEIIKSKLFFNLDYSFSDLKNEDIWSKNSIEAEIKYMIGNELYTTVSMQRNENSIASSIGFGFSF